MKLIDLVDVDTLEQLQRSFCKATGMSIGITDLEGNPIVPSKDFWTRLCTFYHRQTPEGEENCHRNDARAGAEAARTRKPFIYRCNRGLIDFAVPVEMKGELIAYMSGGQVLDEEPDLEKFGRQAEELGIEDVDGYLEAVKEINVIPKARIEGAANLLHIIANTISQLAYQRLIQKEKADEMEKTAEALLTPIVPITDNILIMPLIGTIDTPRSQKIMESLLHGISQHQAQVVIIDITGVPMVDTSVANHLLQTARAAAMLGSRVVLVGISAEIAQTIIQLEIDLSDITTIADLRGGVEFALGLVNKRIVPIKSEFE